MLATQCLGLNRKVHVPIYWSDLARGTRSDCADLVLPYATANSPAKIRSGKAATYSALLTSLQELRTMIDAKKMPRERKPA